MDTNDFKEALKKDYVPSGVLSFDELEKYREAEETARKTYSLIDDFMGLIYRVIEDPNVVNKAQRIVALSQELESRVAGEMTSNETDAEQTEKSWNAILKAGSDDERRLAYGVVLKPDVVDAQGDVMTTDEIEKAAHAFFVNSRIMDLQHREDLPSDRAVPVESYIAPQDMVVGGRNVAKGSWVMVTHIPDEAIWTQIKKGQIMAYSIRGLGKRTPVD